MTAFIASFVMIFFAEMGDKTQLLALAFSSKYKLGQVLAGAFLATIVLNSAAVGAGKLLVSIVPFNVITVIAALSFVAFGIWSLKSEHGEENKTGRTRFGPIATVFLAFLLAELGDKTQLAAISLSIEYKSFIAVLCGSSLALFSADTIGIMAGGILKKYVPESSVKWISALLFIFFGLWSLVKIYLKSEI